MTKQTLIIPCYNEEHRLPKEDIFKFLETSSNINFIFVNDGSKDKTKETIENLIQDFPQADILNFDENQGKAEAVRQGMLKAVENQSDIIGFFRCIGITQRATVYS
jgi:glycosyltransferase involved in cell wall biosynthesis